MGPSLPLPGPLPWLWPKRRRLGRGLVTRDPSTLEELRFWEERILSDARSRVICTLG